MARDASSATRSALIGLTAYAAVLLIHSTLPFVMLPTLGQAVWSMGFAESFAHGPWYEIYARHFGLPNPAPIAFGLAGAWPASVLIRLSLHAADAYAAVLAFWLGVALLGAYRIGRLFNARPSIAWLGGVAWLGMPVVWAHAEYSMLSLGIALLAFYYWTALMLFASEDGLSRQAVGRGLLYTMACTISVFMDGYTFVMFAFGSSLLWLSAFLYRRPMRKRLLQVALPIHIVGFAFAYLLYGLYIGKATFSPQPLDFFRGWSLDPIYLLIPTQGMQWLMDAIGWSALRSSDDHFGDGSVWRTTFGLPLLIVGLLASWRVWQVRAVRPLGITIFVTGMIAFYLALGPTLKFDSTKPTQLQQEQPGDLSSSMQAEHGVMPTGSSWIYSNLPAFNVMRATYRWSALGFFAFWLLIMLWVGQVERSQGRDRWMITALWLVIIINLPALPEKWQVGAANRAMFKQIDVNLVATLKRYLAANETVVFIPWQNDFLINYVAPAAAIRTLNIGGDKNITIASQSWPIDLRALERSVSADDAAVALKLLIDGDVEALVVPYFDTLKSAHTWPCPIPSLFSDKFNKPSSDAITETCKAEQRRRAAQFLDKIGQMAILEIEETDWFAVIRLKDALDNAQSRVALSHFVADQFVYPMEPMGPHRIHEIVLQDGWHAREPNQVWSTDKAHLNLPIPSACMMMLQLTPESAQIGAQTRCQVRLTMGAFGASEKRPVSIVIATGQPGFEQRIEITRITPAAFDLVLPLLGRNQPWQPLTIEVPQAVSPKTLSGASDARTLGVSLLSIELIESNENS